MDNKGFTGTNNVLYLFKYLENINNPPVQNVGVYKNRNIKEIS